jgi:tetratricopeptide (TPR) repeat protein
VSAPFNLAQSFNEALALQRQGRLREAEKIYARVLKAAPDHFDALNLLGTVKAQQGQIGEAHRLFSAAVKINPNVAGAWANLGQALHALKRNDEALRCLDKARSLAPQDINVLHQHANTLLSLGRSEEAFSGFRDVLARAPRHGEARLNCGIACAALGRFDEAVAEFDAALALGPAHPAVHYNRALALQALGRYAEALEAHDRALAAAPQHAGAWLHRGRALFALKRTDEALASYGKAGALRKSDPDVDFSESMALLALGDYRRGFAKYEARWRRTGMPEQKSRGRPLWRGEYSLAGKTVLLHAEQGLGDTIQFARYVPLVAAAGPKRILLEVQPELTALLAQLAGGATVIARGDAIPPIDVHCPLGSLPLAMATELASVPAAIPYLSADDAALAKWSARLERLKRPRVALAWSGNPTHYNDRNRSIPFACLAPLLALPASFISIQRELRDNDAAQLAAEQRITHLGGELENFTDTAAVMALCDLVISADTAVAHLAGAMDRPLWVMIPFAPDWRWTLEGETSPWYPAARLFRQSGLGDWAGVMTRVAEALARFIASAG